MGDAFLATHEGQWFERKSGRIHPRELAVPLVAMANAEGGTVIVGVHDGKVDGVPDAQLNRLRQASLDFTEPPVTVHVTEIRAQRPTGEPTTLLHFLVAPGELVHQLKNGDCFLRVGDESRKLSFQQRQELSYDRGRAPYDGTPAGTDRADLAPTLLEEYHRATASTRDVEHLLVARSLLTRQGQVTVAAHLLFSDFPQAEFPHAVVRVLRYDSTERGSGRRQHLTSDGDVRCDGPIPSAIHQAVGAIERLIPKRRALGSDGRFSVQPIVPTDAWTEGLVNAVIHRSYSAAGDYVRVEIFNDRLEIESPGRFPGIVHPENPLAITRFARNPRITRVAVDLGIAQELGEGIKRIFTLMQERGLTDPIYQQTPGTVRLILSSEDAIAPIVRSRLSRNARDVLDALRLAHRPLGTGEVMEVTGLSRMTVKRHLESLRDEGLVAWQGKSITDPRATWESV